VERVKVRIVMAMYGTNCLSERRRSHHWHTQKEESWEYRII